MLVAPLVAIEDIWEPEAVLKIPPIKIKVNICLLLPLYCVTVLVKVHPVIYRLAKLAERKEINPP